MAETSSIEWTDATWNPITGCSVISPGCTNCYAMKLAGGRMKKHPSRAGLTQPSKAGPVWNGKVRLNRAWLHQPAQWSRGRRIFVCAHGDLFHEDVPDEWILDVFTVMASADHHHYQVLTKRSERAREFLSRRDLLDDIYANWSTFSGKPEEVYSWPLHNVAIGASVEDQKHANQRLHELRWTPARQRFVSAEPLLGAIDLTRLNDVGTYATDALRGIRVDPANGHAIDATPRAAIDWVIAGGESGAGARPMHPDWVRKIRDDCAAAGVPFFFKQWGEWREAFHDEDGPAVTEVDADTEEAQSFASLAHKPCWMTRYGVVYRRVEEIGDVPARMMERLGKKAAGRVLDGVEHNGLPEIPRGQV